MGLVARFLEKAGFPTICLTAARSITESVNPPRAAFVDMPLGYTAGRPNEPEFQRDPLRKVFKAAENSMCLDFINKLENKYDTKIGDNGIKLSGGERQRLSIARAFLKNSRIILLDEATSSLDSETEKKIQKALDVLTYNKTTIVIAHRLSTILNSDNIYVMDQGSVVGSGKHEDLLKESETYKNFYNRQIYNN